MGKSESSGWGKMGRVKGGKRGTGKGLKVRKGGG